MKTIEWTLNIDGEVWADRVKITDGGDNPAVQEQALKLALLRLGETISIHALGCPDDGGEIPEAGGRVRFEVEPKAEYEKRRALYANHPHPDFNRVGEG